MATVAASLQTLAGKTVTAVVITKSFEQKVNEAATQLTRDISATHQVNGTKSVDPRRMMVEIERAKRDFSDNLKVSLSKPLPVRPLSREEKEDMLMGAYVGGEWINFTK